MHMKLFLEIVQPTIKPGIFLDEIQNIKGWERFVRALHEKGSADIFVSGSSAKLLSKELGTALTGRHYSSYPGLLFCNATKQGA
jgi:hypothetical protein